MTERQISVRPFVIVGILICAAGTAVGIVMSILSSAIYLPWGPYPQKPLAEAFAVTLGAICGLAAAYVWCRCVIWPGFGELSGDPTQPRPVSMRGVLWGMAVGTSAGVMVHLGLIYATDRWSDAGLLLVGMICGVVAGAVTGLVCSFALGVAVGYAMHDPAGDHTDDAS